MVVRTPLLMALVSVAIGSLFMWSIRARYRDAGYEHLRIGG
jgi:hypothetical protein